MERITAELLIPGSGHPVRDGVVLLDGAAIGYAGPASGAPDTPGAAILRQDSEAQFRGNSTRTCLPLTSNEIALPAWAAVLASSKPARM